MPVAKRLDKITKKYFITLLPHLFLTLGHDVTIVLVGWIRTLLRVLRRLLYILYFRNLPIEREVLEITQSVVRLAIRQQDVATTRFQDPFDTTNSSQTKENNVH